MIIYKKCVQCKKKIWLCPILEPVCRTCRELNSSERFYKLFRLKKGVD